MNTGSNNQEDALVVERLIDKKIINGATFYMVKWQGWPESYNTWEPESRLGKIPIHFKKMIENGLKGQHDLQANLEAIGSVEEFTLAGGDGKSLEAIRIEQENDSSYGSFKYGDQPLKVLHIDVIARTNVNAETNCLVQWKERANGRKPKNSVFSNALLKSKCPLLLVEYYESIVGKDKPAQSELLQLPVN